MKNIAITIFVVLIFVGMGIKLVAFQVRETELALVKRFGNPIREITEPGLYFKWPAPIDMKEKFDSRVMITEIELNETTTKGALPIIIQAYVLWRIAEPLKFHNSVQGVSNAQDSLRSLTRDVGNNVLGKHNFSEFVNSDPNKIKLQDIQNEMLASLSKAVDDSDYGIKIETLGIKQLKIDQDVTKAVFERMKAERNSATTAIMDEGKALAARIKTDAKSKRAELLAAAEARAKAIRAQGDASAAQYYKLMSEDSEFAMFLRDIEAIKKILGNRTTYVVPTDIEPFDLLRGIRALQPAGANER